MALAFQAGTYRYYGSMGNVIPLHGRPKLPDSLDREEAAELVRQVVEDSAHIVWKEHAYVQMERRRVTDMQVLQVLGRGEVVSDPEWTEERNWKFSMEADTAGEVVRVVVALDVDKMGHFIVVITVIVP